ncbi:MAG: hypothetical protein LBU44_03985 [Mediterranea sp.]|jgi:hypothetical protein|nr:hypothetical protein [Mediterranea sp.]
MNGQSFVGLMDGRSFYGDIESENEKEMTIEIDRRIVKIPKENIALIESEEGGVDILRKEGIKEVNVDNYTGLLYAKGNCIYIPYSSTKIVFRVGSRVLRQLLARDGYWKVVRCNEEAHCIFEYVFDDSRADKAFIRIRDREGNVLLETQTVPAADFIPHHAGEESAQRLYNKEIPKLKKMIELQ